MKISHPVQADVRPLSLKHLVFILLLGAIVFNFFLAASFQHALLKVLFSSALSAFFLMASILGALLGAGALMVTRLQDPDAAWSQTLWVLSPAALLFFWPAQEIRLGFLLPLGIVALTSAAIFRILTRPAPEKKPGGQVLSLCLLMTVYFLFFSAWGAAKFNALQLFNPKDWAVYDQIFWNTLHGALFTSSFYGSYLAGHNTWFFFLLMPFYALFPHPLTLLVLKTLLLSLSAVPFYRIAKDIFRDEPPFALILCFLFFPFLVAQNLNAPHEMGFAPFFLLWTYYFYRTGRFLPFLGFLLALLSIKEHLSAVVVGFGLYALLQKRDRRWVIAPAALGILWGIFSLGLMAHFQKLYPAQSDPSWFLTELKRHYLSCRGGGFLSFVSNLGDSLPAALLLLFPLGVLPPLLSSISLLALPEVFLNLLAKRAVLFSPVWHYNVAGSCFLLLGSIEGVKKIAGSRWTGNFKFRPGQARSVVAVLMFAAVMIHSYLWLDSLAYKKNAVDVTTVREAIAVVPGDAFFTVPSYAAPLISRRERMSLLGEGEAGEFVLIDRAKASGPFKGPGKARYKEIFRKKGISVYQKIL